MFRNRLKLLNVLRKCLFLNSECIFFGKSTGFLHSLFSCFCTQLPAYFIAYYQALSISPDISPLENTESVLYNFLNKQKGAFHGKSALYH